MPGLRRLFEDGWRISSPNRHRAGRGACAFALALIIVTPLSPYWFSLFTQEDMTRRTTSYIQVASAEMAAKPGMFSVAGPSALGSYLAAKFALSLGDTSAAVDFLREALASDPDNNDLLHDTFRVSLADGRIKEATALANLLIKKNEQAGLPNIVLAVIAVKDGNLESALYRLNKISDSRFNSIVVPLLTAWCLAGEGKSEIAAEQLTSIFKRQSLDIFRLYHTALIYDQGGHVVNAEAAYREAISISGSDGRRIAEGLGNFLERSLRTEDAHMVYDNMLKADPFDILFSTAKKRTGKGEVPEAMVGNAVEGAAESFFGLASALAQDSAHEDALIYARLALLLREDFPIAHTLLGNIFENLGRWEDAIDQYQLINVASPFALAAQVRIASNLARLDRGDEAIALLRELAESRIDHPNSLISLGDLYRSQKKWLEAVREYDRAFNRKKELLEKDWTLLYARGIALERSKQWARAEADFLRALELKPNQPLVLNYLGYSWVEQGRYLDRALDMIRRAVNLRPRDGYIVDSLGWVLFRQGRYDEAVRELERAVELMPQDPIINDHLGDAFWRTDRLNEARFQWNRAIFFEPEPDLIPIIEEKLRGGLPEIDEGMQGG